MVNLMGMIGVLFVILGVFAWHESLVKKMAMKNVKLVILGKSVLIFALGVLFADYIIRYTAILLIISLILMVPCIMHITQEVLARKKKLEYEKFLLLYLGAGVLVFVLGALLQPLFIDSAVVLFAIGILLLLKPTHDFVKGLNL